MITTITLNPAIDKMVEINKMKLGSVHRVTKVIKALGGKSINVSRILAGLKIQSEAVCFLGRWNLEEIEAYAKEDDIVLKSILVDGLTRTNVKIIEPDMNYRTTDINEPGFVINEELKTQMMELILNTGKASEYVVLSGSLPEGVEADFYGKIIKALGKETKVVLDADGEVLLEGLKSHPFIIKPNIHELESALKCKLDSLETLVEACKKLILMYKISYVLVSMGEKGSVLVSKNEVFRGEALPVKVVSTVGAGDSMLAGFIYGLEHYKNHINTVSLALACGIASSAIAISTQNHIGFTEEELMQSAAKVIIHPVDG